VVAEHEAAFPLGGTGQAAPVVELGGTVTPGAGVLGAGVLGAGVVLPVVVAELPVFDPGQFCLQPVPQYKSPVPQYPHCEQHKPGAHGVTGQLCPFTMNGLTSNTTTNK
jgi:hypothetical protein